MVGKIKEVLLNVFVIILFIIIYSVLDATIQLLTGFIYMNLNVLVNHL